ncbi:MAG: DUF1571 domain-containing protein [Pirellulales bacterium]
MSRGYSRRQFLKVPVALSIAAAAPGLTGRLFAEQPDFLADQTARPGEHPLMPALRIANYGKQHIEQNIQDYSCTIVKRERIDGTLGDNEYMFAKVRHQPFSVYLYFLGPDAIKGREVMYVDGSNENKLMAHEAKGIRSKFGTVSLHPDSFLAMKGQRYPITELGVLNLTKRLIEVAEHDKQYGECEVKFYNGAKINGRTCTCIEVTHPVPRKQFLFHIARVFVDSELKVPVRYEAYEWPETQGGPPVLLEQYTYLNMKINNGFADSDFDHRNPNYRFVRN